MYRDELSELLAAFVPGSPAEAASVGDVRDLYESPGPIFDRDHFVPGHITTSAVVVSPDGTQMALIDHHKLGVWLQPGGHVEPDDRSLVASAVREVVEECGPLTVEPLGLFDVDVHRVPVSNSEPSHLHFDLRFLCQVISGSLSATEHVAAVAWFELGDRPQRLGESVGRLMDKVAALPLAPEPTRESGC